MFEEEEEERRGKERNGAGSANRNFLRSTVKNGVIDHANSASPAIRIMTLFEFSVKSSIFITAS